MNSDILGSIIQCPAVLGLHIHINSSDRARFDLDMFLFCDQNRSTGIGLEIACLGLVWAKDCALLGSVCEGGLLRLAAVDGIPCVGDVHVVEQDRRP